jgi:hypothetical protein
MQKIYAEFCRLRDLRDAGVEAPKYTEAQAFAIATNPSSSPAADPTGDDARRGAGDALPVATDSADQDGAV